MKTVLAFLACSLILPSAFAGTTLARCSHSVSVIKSGKVVYLQTKDKYEPVTRTMRMGYVMYQSDSVRLEIHGNVRSFGRLTGTLSPNANIRSFGNPKGYLANKGKVLTVLCDSGVDVEKIADDTDLY